MVRVAAVCSSTGRPNLRRVWVRVKLLSTKLGSLVRAPILLVGALAHQRQVNVFSYTPIGGDAVDHCQRAGAHVTI